MEQSYDVIIAGAGPIGLLLAGELALQNVSVIVLERDADPKSPWKTLPLGRRGLNTLSFEALYRRGMLGKFVDMAAGGFMTMDKPREGGQPEAEKKKPRFGGHFAGIMIDPGKIELDRWKYRLDGPALYPAPTTLELIETTLSERTESLGVKILRGSGFVKITEQTSTGVTVETNDHKTFRGKWLVGCDGGRSTVRHEAGIEFIGSDPKFTCYGAHCDFDHPERLKPGFHQTKNGMYIYTPQSLYVIEFDDGAFDRSRPLTVELLQDRFEYISGVKDIQITAIHLGTIFTDRAKQAATYRQGRVLLAGDAAHIHSPLGAQGLNLGLGDALNLGWKLAATIRREGTAGTPLEDQDLTLLDTYHAERYPLGAKVLEWTRAQVAILQPTPFGNAINQLIRELIETTDGANLFMDRVMGLSNRYELGADAAHAHPLVGCSAPDFELADGARLGPKFISGKGLLVDFGNDAQLKDAIVGSKYEGRIDYLATSAKNQCDLRALLVRPDGFVAWVTDEGKEPDMEALGAALERWFAF